MTEQEYRRSLAADGFPEPVMVERDSTYGLDIHEHPFEAYALILAGELTIEVDGQPTIYRAGDTFRLPAHCPHREKAGAHGVRYLSGRKG